MCRQRFIFMLLHGHRRREGGRKRESEYLHPIIWKWQNDDKKIDKINIVWKMNKRTWRRRSNSSSNTGEKILWTFNKLCVSLALWSTHTIWAKRSSSAVCFYIFIFFTFDIRLRYNSAIYIQAVQKCEWVEATVPASTSALTTDF